MSQTSIIGISAKIATMPYYLLSLSNIPKALFSSRVNRKPQKSRFDLFDEDSSEMFNNLNFENTETNLEKESDDSVLISDFDISSETKNTLHKAGFTHLFSIQKNSFKPIMEGKDIIAKDRTGSGKTLAFALSILEKMRKEELIGGVKKQKLPYVLVLTPTRELANQVNLEFNRLKNKPGEFNTVCLYGGVKPNEQIMTLKAGVEIVVGTPGRVMDMHERGELKFEQMRCLILDETDQMLDIGFQPDIEAIIKKIKTAITKEQAEKEIQFLLFSATVPRWVQGAAKNFLKPGFVFIDNIKDQGTKTSKTVEHLSIHVKNSHLKANLVKDLVMKYVGPKGRCIIFTETKLDASRINEIIKTEVKSRELHGDIDQDKRDKTTQLFREGKIQCLVATDVAARGLDIPDVDLVIQLEAPHISERYIHRSGRTGRAGKTGTCITFYNNKEHERLVKIERDAKLTFKTISPPQPEELIKLKIDNMKRDFDQISKEKLKYVDNIAADIIETYGPKDAVCRLLANMYDTEQFLMPKSLLTSAKGYVAYVIEMPLRTSNINTIRDSIFEFLDDNVKDAIGDIEILENNDGVVLDIKLEKEDQIVNVIQTNSGFKVYKVKSPPAIKMARNNRNSNERKPHNTETPSSSNNSKTRFRYDDESNLAKDRLYITNLSKSTTHDEIRNILKKNELDAGRIYLSNKSPVHNNGYAYIQLHSNDEADKALEILNGYTLNGNQLKAYYAFKDTYYYDKK